MSKKNKMQQQHGGGAVLIGGIKFSQMQVAAIERQLRADAKKEGEKNKEQMKELKGQVDQNMAEIKERVLTESHNDLELDIQFKVRADEAIEYRVKKAKYSGYIQEMIDNGTLIEEEMENLVDTVVETMNKTVASANKIVKDANRPFLDKLDAMKAEAEDSEENIQDAEQEAA